MKLPFMPETGWMFWPCFLGGWGMFLLSGWVAYPGLTQVFTVVGILLVIGSGFILNFFRDFERYPERGLSPKEVLAPADGKVVVLRKTKEKFYIKKPTVQVAIFMNPLDNHVQRAPYDGKVMKKVYHPGKFLAAYADKADLVNEQTHLVVDLKAAGKRGRTIGRMVLKQIAGLLCHRVRTTPEPGDTLSRGKRFGRILLGSRVDVFLPSRFKPAVKLGDRVKAGVTVLGELS